MSIQNTYNPVDRPSFNEWIAYIHKKPAATMPQSTVKNQSSASSSAAVASSSLREA